MEFFNFEMMRKMQADRKAEGKRATQATYNRGNSVNQNSSRSAEGDRFRAIYDRDEGLRVAYVNLSAAQTQQFYTETERAWTAFTSSLKSAGHELSPSGIKKFQDYLSHQKTDTQLIDVTKPETWVEAFNRFVNIGGFTTGDFLSDAPVAAQPLTGRAREDADRAEYLRELRAELGDTEYERRYGRNGQHPLGARRPNDPVWTYDSARIG